MNNDLKWQARLEDRITKLIQAALQSSASEHRPGEWCFIACTREPVNIYIDGELILWTELPHLIPNQ